MNIYEFKEWRFRLGLSVEATAELLGVSKATVLGWEIGTFKITKQTQLATLACELAYIAADQYVKAHPYPSVNNGIRNFVAQSGRKKIREGIINGRNTIERELSIILAPKSLIQYEVKGL